LRWAGTFQGEGQQERWPRGEHVLANDELVVAVAFPILEVVQNLKRDAEVFAELGDHLLVFVGVSGEADTGVQGGFKRGSCLQGVNLERFEGRERFLGSV